MSAKQKKLTEAEKAARKKAQQKAWYERNRETILLRRAIARQQRPEIREREKGYLLKHYSKKLAQLNK